MPVFKRTLKVLPNPWLYIDHKGRPAGRVPFEQPTNGTYDPRTVGSRFADNPELVSAARKDVPLAQDVHDTVVEYAKEPVDVGNTVYYRRRIMAGELIAADRESYVAAGGRPKDFEDHQKHLDAKKAEAIAEFDLRNGEGAFKALEQQRDEDAKAAAAAKKATSPEAQAEEAKKATDAKRDADAKAAKVAAGDAEKPAAATTTTTPSTTTTSKGDGK